MHREAGRVAELLPLGQPCAKVDIVGVGEQLIELLLIRSVRPFDLAVELRRRWSDIGMANSLVFNMPMELGLELMAVVRSHLADAEREFVNDGVDEVDRVRLIVAVVDFQGANARGIVDRGVLVALDRLAVFAFEFQELTSTWI